MTESQQQHDLLGLEIAKLNKRLIEGLDAINRRLDEIVKRVAPPATHLRFKIRGKPFEVEKDVLRRYPKTFFGGLTSGGFGGMDTDIVLDRDPECFSHIVSFLMDGEFSETIPKRLQSKMLAEADFFNLPQIKDVLRYGCVPSEYEQPFFVVTHYDDDDDDKNSERITSDMRVDTGETLESEFLVTGGCYQLCFRIDSAEGFYFFGVENTETKKIFALQSDGKIRGNDRVTNGNGNAGPLCPGDTIRIVAYHHKSTVNIEVNGEEVAAFDARESFKKKAPWRFFVESGLDQRFSFRATPYPYYEGPSRTEMDESNDNSDSLC